MTANFLRSISIRSDRPVLASQALGGGRYDICIDFQSTVSLLFPQVLFVVTVKYSVIDIMYSPHKQSGLPQFSVYTHLVPPG